MDRLKLAAYLILSLALSFAIATIATLVKDGRLAENRYKELQEALNQTSVLLTAEQEEKEMLSKKLSNVIEERELLQNIVLRREEAVEAAEKCGMPRNHAEHMVHLSEDYSIPPELMLAVYDLESQCQHNKHNVNENGSEDWGYSQINSVNWGSFESRTGLSPFEPMENLELGVWHLSNLYQKYRDLDTALTAYNRGEGGMRNYAASRGGDARSLYSEVILANWIDKMNSE